MQRHNPYALARRKTHGQGCRGGGDDRNTHPRRLSLRLLGTVTLHSRQPRDSVPALSRGSYGPGPHRPQVCRVQVRAVPRFGQLATMLTRLGGRTITLRTTLPASTAAILSPANAEA